MTVPNSVTNAVHEWPGRLAVTTLYIAPASLWAKGYIERFNARLREALRNGEIFYSLAEVRTVNGWWRDHYNRTRPHCSLAAASDVDHTGPGHDQDAKPIPTSPIGTGMKTTGKRYSADFKTKVALEPIRGHLALAGPPHHDH